MAQMWLQQCVMVFLFSGIGTIHSVHINGTGYKKLETLDGLTAMTLGDDALIWMTTNGNDIVD